MNQNKVILKFSCEDKLGIVADVSTFFSGQKYNIVESSQFEDGLTKRFFMRTSFVPTDKVIEVEKFRQQFQFLAERYEMEWTIQSKEHRPNVVLAVSKWGHCLNNLLHSWRSGTLPINIVAVVSNHNDMRSLVEWYNVDYHHLPVTKETKQAQEASIIAVMDDINADF